MIPSAGSGATLNFEAATLAAYEHWAPTYPPVAHNPLMRAEQQAMSEQWPDVAGRRVLDLACGSGRYTKLLAKDAAQVVALDFCAPMLAQIEVANRVRASMMQLPFARESFDAAISGLALGHATGIDAWMAEVARVLARDGVLLYSDFHPEAARAGLPRSFKDRNDEVREVPHRCYDVASQEAAVAAAGLTLEAVREVRVGIELTEPFSRSEEFYRQWHGLPIVLVIRARK